MPRHESEVLAADEAKARRVLRDARIALNVAITPGGFTTDIVSPRLTKLQASALLALIDMTLEEATHV